MGPRRLARELALQILFQYEFNPDLNTETSLGLYRDSFEAEPELWNYARLIVDGVFQRRHEIDTTIRTQSTHWKLERMSLVDRNILRIAIFEIQFGNKEVPPNVAINEAIEVAKKFGTLESAGFINGILDPISKNEFHR